MADFLRWAMETIPAASIGKLNTAWGTFATRRAGKPMAARLLPTTHLDHPAVRAARDAASAANEAADKRAAEREAAQDAADNACQAAMAAGAPYEVYRSAPKAAAWLAER